MISPGIFFSIYEGAVNHLKQLKLKIRPHCPGWHRFGGLEESLHGAVGFVLTTICLASGAALQVW